MTLKCYLTVGCLASGKTKIAKEIATKEHLIYLNPDEFWDRKSIKEYSPPIWINAWSEVYKRVYQAIKNEQSFIIDSIQKNHVVRKEIINVIRSIAHNQCEIIGMWVKTDLDKCIERNKIREDSVPEEEIIKVYNIIQQEPPSLEEDGYDRIIEVENN